MTVFALYCFIISLISWHNSNIYRQIKQSITNPFENTKIIKGACYKLYKLNLQINVIS